MLSGGTSIPQTYYLITLIPNTGNTGLKRKSKNMPPTSKAELEEIIRQQAAKIEELEEQLAAREAVMYQSQETGWLITSPNSRYNGFTAGIEFRNGRGFVPSGKRDAKLIVLRLQYDFGYRVSEITAKDYQALQETDDTEPERKNFVEQVSIPGVMGG
jgi:hypothetical protein